MCCNEKQEGCQKPKNLTGKPEDCSPEQIRKCHGDMDAHPCVKMAGCEHPERLQGKPGECSPELGNAMGMWLSIRARRSENHLNT
ncbi:MAG: hypothetical protein JXB13_01250 [Phycisphaerae bacterium]|nr:hypothetical protein [Phycisphaerae bacterium]